MKRRFYILLIIMSVVSCTATEKKQCELVQFKVNRKDQSKIIDIIKSKFPHDTVFVFGQIGLKSKVFLSQIKQSKNTQKSIILDVKTDSVEFLSAQDVKTILQGFNFRKLVNKIIDSCDKKEFISGYSDYFIMKFESSELEEYYSFYGWKINWGNKELYRVNELIKILNK